MKLKSAESIRERINVASPVRDATGLEMIVPQAGQSSSPDFMSSIVESYDDDGWMADSGGSTEERDLEEEDELEESQDVDSSTELVTLVRVAVESTHLI